MGKSGVNRLKQSKAAASGGGMGKSMSGGGKPRSRPKGSSGGAGNMKKPSNPKKMGGGY